MTDAQRLATSADSAAVAASDGPRTPRRWQNFDAIRLFAATMVVVSHSFLLSGTGYTAEPFVRWLGYHNDLGLTGVGIFFVISGFLITRSFERRASTLSFLINRMLRIFPALVICTLFAALVIGPFVASHAVDYLTSGHTWKYIWRTSLLQDGDNFPVRLYNGDQGNAMLGTTWSLPVEFQCYFLIVLLGFSRLLRWPVVVAILLAGVWTHSQWTKPYLEGASWALMFFAAGSLLHFIYKWRRPPVAVAWLCAVGLLGMAFAGLPLEGLALFGSVLVIQLATSERFVLPDVARFGDLSYGVYLYGWPMQQVVRVVWGPSVTWWQMFALAMPLALACAWVSWHLIEARALEVARNYQRDVVAANARPSGADTAVITPATA